MARKTDSTVGIAALLKHEAGDLHRAELARSHSEDIRVFLHRVADERQGADRLFHSLALSVGEHPPDLSRSRTAMEPLHQLKQASGLGDPIRRPTLVEPAIVDELKAESADRRDLPKHLAL